MTPQGGQVFEQPYEFFDLTVVKSEWLSQRTEPVAVDEIGVASLGLFPEISEARFDEGLASLDPKVLFLKAGALSFGATKLVLASASLRLVLELGLAGRRADDLDGGRCQRLEEFAFNDGVQSARPNDAADLVASFVPPWQAAIRASSPE